MGITKGGLETANRLTPEQQEVFSKLMADFDPTMLTQAFQTGVADPARQQFQQQTLPGIQERFTAGGGSRSGALGRAGVQAGTNLEQGLAGQLAQLLAQAQEGTTNRQAALSTSSIQDIYQTPSDNPLAALLAPIAQGAGYAAGGPLGAAGTSYLSGKNTQQQAPSLNSWNRPPNQR